MTVCVQIAAQPRQVVGGISFSDGQWDGKPNHNVDANSPKEAAEKLSGAALREQGSNDKIQAEVLVSIGGRMTKYTFFSE
jgi:hypothetical protein